MHCTRKGRWYTYTYTYFATENVDERYNVANTQKQSRNTIPLLIKACILHISVVLEITNYDSVGLEFEC